MILIAELCNHMVVCIQESFIGFLQWEQSDQQFR